MTDKSQPSPPPGDELIVYLTEDGKLKVDVRFQGETAWLSLSQMAELFQRDKSVISRHIKNVFDEGELARSSVVAESATTAADGKTYQVEFYNLDVIISREEADSLAVEEYERFSARRRTQLENEGQADTLTLLEAEVKKMPGAKIPKRPKP